MSTDDANGFVTETAALRSGTGQVSRQESQFCTEGPWTERPAPEALSDDGSTALGRSSG